VGCVPEGLNFRHANLAKSIEVGKAKSAEQYKRINGYGLLLNGLRVLLLNLDWAERFTVLPRALGSGAAF
jgi:hypothetical protein